MTHTAKYSRLYPKKPFETLEDAKLWIKSFVNWYNFEHLHSGIKFVTPIARHVGSDDLIIKNRIKVYKEAQSRHPKRWSKKIRNWELPQTVTLNPGKQPVK